MLWASRRWPCPWCSSALTAPGKNSQLEIERDGSIAITQNAIQSTVSTWWSTQSPPSTDNVRSISPTSTIRAWPSMPRSIPAATPSWASWARSCSTISSTLEAFTGYPVDFVRITFAGDADVVTPAFTQQATKYSEDTHRQHQTQPVPAHAVGK
ncbi:MAG: hypothetical protein V8S24_06420 [Gordonibacter pamelaeae]